MHRKMKQKMGETSKVAKRRCAWVEGKPNYYLDYHDQVWGKPEHDDAQLFKWLILESFHVGLSWQLVLSKMAAFERAFDSFDYVKIAQYTEAKVEALLEDPTIIRHRAKIQAAISNAQAFQRVQAEYGSFAAYIWSFTDGQVVRNKAGERLTRSELSDAVTKSLKRFGFKFVGSVTIYSYLQAIGVIDDHEPQCYLCRQ